MKNETLVGDGRVVSYNWSLYVQDKQLFRAWVLDKKINNVIAINRGGLVFGVSVSNLLRLPLNIIGTKDKIPYWILDNTEPGVSLIVDDIYDSGTTMKNALDFVTNSIGYTLLASTTQEEKDDRVTYSRLVTGEGQMDWPWFG